ncbi:MAG: hypothetical protein GY943_12090, partial [Chloroflexi bacterium]|nr:hypothetical protein [Chloroflexota bacterium]
MTIFGLLNTFDELPAFKALLTAVETQAETVPLELPRSARAAVLAKLFMTQQRPVILVTGRVDSVSAWMQALEMWLPEEIAPLRFPEPTPLPYDRGPWSETSRNGRLTVLTQLMAGQHPQIPAATQPPIIVTSARALLQKTLPKRRFSTATRVLRVGQIIDMEK